MTGFAYATAALAVCLNMGRFAPAQPEMPSSTPAAQQSRSAAHSTQRIGRKSRVADGSATDFNGANKSADIMEIRKTVTGDTHELLVAGRVDGAGANQLELEILATIRANAQSIYINLSQATFLCSAGLRALLQYWRQMKNNQRVLLVTRPSPEVDAVLATTGFKEQIVEKM